MRALVGSFVLVFSIMIAAPALAGETVSGKWTIDTSKNGTTRISLRYSDGQGNHDTNNSDMKLPANALPADALTAPQQHVTFSIQREAGKYDFDGQLVNGRGGGSYTLTLDDRFFEDMRARGYDTNSTAERVAFASLDITREYVDEMDQLGLHTTTSQMIAMRALAVDAAYVRDLRAGKISGLTVANIIAMRALNVDSNYIRYLRAHGIKNLSAANVIAMKAENI